MVRPAWKAELAEVWLMPGEGPRTPLGLYESRLKLLTRPAPLCASSALSPEERTLRPTFNTERKVPEAFVGTSGRSPSGDVKYGGPAGAWGQKPSEPCLNAGEQIKPKIQIFRGRV